MLHYKTIDSKTLELLIKLQKVNDFKELYLVGETALALLIGHRKSFDIDLFGRLDVDAYRLADIFKDFKQVQLVNQTSNIHTYIIDGIKVDIVNYSYDWLEEPFNVDNITIAHVHDIIAMKLAAITGRGLRKDFIDVFYLMQKFSLHQMLDFYEKKYPDGSVFLVLKSLAYFEDADIEVHPIMVEQINWNFVKNYIENVVKLYLKNNISD